jgi:uncharacterized membrane protein (GlpM family)
MGGLSGAVGLRVECRPARVARAPPGYRTPVSDVLTILVKSLAGGTLVVAFAVLSETLTPKRFAGLFSAAPAVAIAGLGITLLTKGVADARDSSRTMIIGAFAMALYAAVLPSLIRRMGSARGSGLAVVVWLAAAAAVTVPVLA